MNPSEQLAQYAEDLGLLSNSFSGVVPDWFNLALEKIGGRNAQGQPHFRVVNGQKATEFAWGKQRIQYPAAFINEESCLGYDLLHTDGTTEFYETQTDLPQLQSGELILPRTLSRKTAIGLPRFIIERWVSPDHLDEETWNSERMQYDIETGELVDALGAFPREGQYRYFLTVQTPDKQFRELGEDVLEIITRTLSVQEKLGRGRSYEEAVREEREEIQARRAKQVEEASVNWADAFNTPLIKGNPQVSVPASYNTPKESK